MGLLKPTTPEQKKTPPGSKPSGVFAFLDPTGAGSYAVRTSRSTDLGFSCKGREAPLRRFPPIRRMRREPTEG